MHILYQFGILFLAVGQLGSCARHGIIGYGIQMYDPWCCYACHGSLATLYLNCTTFAASDEGHAGMSMKVRKRMDMNMEMEATTTNECYASNEPFQRSFAYCVKIKCDLEQIPGTIQNKCFQKLAAGGLAVPSLQESLPRTPPTEELSEDATWLNTTMLVNAAYWSADRQTIQAFETSERDHSKYFIIIIAISVGLPISAAVWLYATSRLTAKTRLNRLLSALQSYLFLPALWGKHCSQPLPWKIGYVPNRAMSAFVSIYIILNVVFCTGPFYSVRDSVWYTNRNQELSAYVANRTGILSFANLALAVLFSGRNNPLIALCGWSQTTCMTFHRWAARMSVLQAVVHSIVYTAQYCYFGDENTYSAEAAQAYFWWGIIATTALAIMVGISALPLRLYAYEVFLVLHIALAILSLIGCWYHVDLRFTKQWGYEVWLYIAFAFWAYDRLMRFIRILYFNRLSKTFAQAEPVTGTNVVMLTLYPGRSWSIKPGEHTFVYFSALPKFWENHPFTICDWGFEPQYSDTSNGSEEVLESAVIDSATSGDTGIADKRGARTLVKEESMQNRQTNGRFYVRCLFRAHKGTTAQLHQKLHTQSLSTTRIMTEGPYGSHRMSNIQILKHAEKILCIVGGIGITYATSFAKQYALEKSGDDKYGEHQQIMPRCNHFTLAWSVREQALLEHVRRSMLPNVEAGGLDDGSMQYRFWLTGDKTDSITGEEYSKESTDQSLHQADQTLGNVSIEQGRRMDVSNVVNSIMEGGKRIVVLVCGPGGLSDDVRQQVVESSKAGFVVDFIEESFNW